jgi:hypothetical protein
MWQSLVGMVILVLLGVTSAAVLAQAASPTPNPMAPAAVTGTITPGEVGSYGSTDYEGYVYERTEGQWLTSSWEASDPRLSGQGTISANWNEAPGYQAGIASVAHVLVTPEGRWLGTGHLFYTEGGQYEMTVLRGEGAYDGWTATLLIQPGSDSPITFEGVIFGAEAPAMPEPVEPPAE